MKNTKHLYIKKILKQHILYLISFTFFILLLSFYLPSQLSTYKTQLDTKNALIESIKNNSIKTKDISAYLPDTVIFPIKLEYFFPTQEDYFSLYRALDDLNIKSGLVMQTNPAPPMNAGASNFVSSVEFLGTYTSIINFLKNGWYLTDRLLTIESVYYIPPTNSLTVGIQYYTVMGSQNLYQHNASFEDTEKIVSIIDNVSINSNPTPIINKDYNTKENPFD